MSADNWRTCPRCTKTANTKKAAENKYEEIPKMPESDRRYMKLMTLVPTALQMKRGLCLSCQTGIDRTKTHSIHKKLKQAACFVRDVVHRERQ